MPSIRRSSLVGMELLLLLLLLMMLSIVVRMGVLKMIDVGIQRARDGFHRGQRSLAPLSRQLGRGECRSRSWFPLDVGRRRPILLIQRPDDSIPIHFDLGLPCTGVDIGIDPMSTRDARLIPLSLLLSVGRCRYYCCCCCDRRLLLDGSRRLGLFRTRLFPFRHVKRKVGGSLSIPNEVE